MKLLTALLIFFFVWSAHASSELGNAFSSKYPDVLIDARGSRGGNGDIAAAYLTVSDWLANFELKSKVTILVDSNGQNRLLKLAHANKNFLDRVEIREPGDGPITKAKSLYLVFANPSGSYRYKQDFGNLITLKKDATLMVQTVLGNTENQNSIHPFAIVEQDGKVFDWAPAGLASYESGIYSDIVARRLRPMTFEEVKKDLQSKLANVEDDFSREAIASVLDGRRLQGAKVGLVYGISAEQTRTQFYSYLQGLTKNTATAHVLFTPSAFREGTLKDERLREKITFLTSLDQMPTVPELGRIYIVETKTLPHELFVGMTALSMKNGVVPVGAGDGFLSAAIELGGPFVLTQVPWNRRNIRRISEMLNQLAIKYDVGSADVTLLKNLLNQNFESSDFRTAASLSRFAPLFRLLKSKLPNMSERIMEVALAAPLLKHRDFTPRFNDQILLESVIKGGRASSLDFSARTCQSIFQN